MQLLNKYKDDATGSVYIGRGSPLGNPYVIGKDGTREEVIERYGKYLKKKLIARDPAIEKALRSLNKDSRLLCFCNPLPCHGKWIDYYHTLLVNDRPYEENLIRLHEIDGKSYRYETDGIDHINVYSKGKTHLGRLLTNFAHRPFNHYKDGYFASVEAYWYWLSSGKTHDEIRPLHGFDCKKIGKTLPRIETEDFECHIKKAILESIEQNEAVKSLLRDNTLPLAHYYVYGAGYTAKHIYLPQYDWIIDYLNEIREYLNGRRVRLLVAGSRSLGEDCYELVEINIKDGPFRPIEIVTGLARGIDTHALNYAKKHKLPWREFPVTDEDWKKYGKSAGHRRNYEMGVYSDAAVIIWDGNSSGSNGMRQVMKNLNKPVKMDIFPF